MEFSQRSAAVINTFAHQLQLPDAQPSEDGSVSFQFERAGTMTLAASANGKRVILSLTAAGTSPQTADDLRGHLERARFDDVTRLPISAGLTTTGARVLAANIPEDRFDLQTLEASIDRLIEIMSA
jgi:transcriptional/translational regulatory protein YebC/TACO1